MQNRVIIIETKQQLAHSLYSRLLEPSLIPSLPWQLLGFLASAGKWPQPSSWHHFDKDMGPTVSNISHCPRVKQSPSPTIIASESLHPFWLPLLQARLCSSCKHFYPEVGKCPPLGIASLSFTWQWSYADSFSGCLLKCSPFSSFVCFTLYYSPLSLGIWSETNTSDTVLALTALFSIVRLLSLTEPRNLSAQFCTSESLIWLAWCLHWGIKLGVPLFSASCLFMYHIIHLN